MFHNYSWASTRNRTPIQKNMKYKNIKQIICANIKLFSLNVGHI